MDSQIAKEQAKQQERQWKENVEQIKGKEFQDENKQRVKGKSQPKVAAKPIPQKPYKLKSPELQRQASNPRGVMSDERDQERLANMKEALKQNLQQFMIQRPFKAETSKKEVLFFNPPLEPRNPELVIHKHIPKPTLKEVLKEKHVPFRQYLNGDDGSSVRPQSAYSANYSTQSSYAQQKKKVDFNIYEKVSYKKKLEIMEVQRKSRIINDRIREINRHQAYTTSERPVSAAKHSQGTVNEIEALINSPSKLTFPLRKVTSPKANERLKYPLPQNQPKSPPRKRYENEATNIHHSLKGASSAFHLSQPDIMRQTKTGFIKALQQEVRDLRPQFIVLASELPTHRITIDFRLYPS